jgi:hypothetical protein
MKFYKEESTLFLDSNWPHLTAIYDYNISTITGGSITTIPINVKTIILPSVKELILGMQFSIMNESAKKIKFKYRNGEYVTFEGEDLELDPKDGIRFIFILDHECGNEAWEWMIFHKNKAYLPNLRNK